MACGILVPQPGIEPASPALEARSLFFFFLKRQLRSFVLFCFVFYLWLCWVFVSVRGLSLVAASGGHSSSWRAGLSLSRPLLLGAQAPDAQAQWLWLTGPVAPGHVGSSQTWARTRVPCIGRQTLNHCAIREALKWHFKLFWKSLFWGSLSKHDVKWTMCQAQNCDRFKYVEMF